MRSTDRAVTEGRIAEAYEELRERAGWEFVSIAALRHRLAGIPHDVLSDALAGLYARQAVNLIPQSNQMALTEDDRRCSVLVGGEHKHLMAWPG